MLSKSGAQQTHQSSKQAAEQVADIPNELESWYRITGAGFNI